MLHSHLTTLNAVSLILNVFQADGAEASALLAGSGIGPADLGHADARITTQQELQVCANAVARREDIGLELGQRMHVSCYGMLGYALLSSATLGDALRLALQYPALLGTVFSLRLRDDGQRVWFSASEYHDNPALSAFNAEFCLVSLKVICDDLLGRPLPLLGARFEHPRPDYHARYAGAFQCPVVFAAQDNAFAFERRWLDTPLPLADPITPQSHERTLPAPEPGIHGSPGLAGADSPVAYATTGRRARAGRAGTADELLVAHVAPAFAGAG